MDLTEEEKQKLKEMLDRYDETMIGFKFIRGLGKILLGILSISVTIMTLIEAIHWWKK